MSKLDQFYTKKCVAKRCWASTKGTLRTLTGNAISDLLFIEPSAGSGAFYDLLPSKEGNRIGIDIETHREEFIKKDFLSWSWRAIHHSREKVVVIGNPPFGRRGNMAVKFFNKSASLADTIAFVVPVIFRKFFIHKSLNEEFRWIRSIVLGTPYAFINSNGRDYRVNAEFQIWTRLPSGHQNLRLFSAPPIAHKDFVMYQYNNTKEALKIFHNPFDFAVPCQGWQDYTRRETYAEKCEKHKQWMLFKARNDKVKQRLREMDYTTLARKNTTSIPGFRKGDMVHEYGLLYDAA